MLHVEIKPWATDDLDLLRRANTPELMDPLGGPESDDQVIARHDRYLRMQQSGTGYQFRVVIPERPEGVGIVGYWEREDSEAELEAGWSVDTEMRGRGIASAAVIRMLQWARANGETRPVHAYPPTTKLASNGVCRKAGFTLIGQLDIEVTPSNVLHTNDWVFKFSSQIVT
ncbi:GNAT family N-acetyltransferase (plasmid) [Arthrobacter agilis]|uniref:GNAT family N-acetyltransferase n=1 Tax=Arthrobacter agilis TaxID=37921 RepID=UPI0023663AB7|nr:GNAT family N-acetyltransferase [Arthrobacter agilis]WDF35095.1 GNAT family N-acetyltransferase [Arthrobacter agilis]